MKKALKWIAIAVGGLVLIAVYYSQDLETQRWGTLGAGLGYGAYVILEKLEKMATEMKALREAMDQQLYDLKKSSEYMESVLSELHQKHGQ